MSRFIDENRQLEAAYTPPQGVNCETYDDLSSDSGYLGYKCKMLTDGVYCAQFNVQLDLTPVHSLAKRCDQCLAVESYRPMADSEYGKFRPFNLFEYVETAKKGPYGRGSEGTEK